MHLAFILITAFFLTLFPSSAYSQSCASPLPGDANNDCRVDGNDYTIWINNYNKKTQLGASEGDFDNNGIVDGRDYIIWRLNYQKTGSDLPSATPSSAQINCRRLFKKNSPWNTPVGSDPKIHPKSRQVISRLTGYLNLDPVKYGLPVHMVNNKTGKIKVKYLRDFRYFDDDRDENDDSDEKRLNIKNIPGQLDLPLPDRATPSSDGKLIILNTDTDEEWNLTGARYENGQWEAESVFKYITRHSGFAPGPFSRSSGIPFLAGLVRACEIRQGNIPHALAFSYPHLKIDNAPFTIPRGTRLQLKPDASKEDIQSWCGFNKICRIFVTAMQNYGLYPVDYTDLPAVYIEHDRTARWGDLINNSLLKNIPLSAFRIVNP